MPTRLKLAYSCYLVAIVGPALFGLTYLLRSEFMPYHAVAAGMSWSSVPSGLQVLILGFLKLAGASWFTTAVAILVILQFPFRAGAPWALRAVPLVALLHYGGVAIAMTHVATHSPAQPPWGATFTGVALVLAGAAFSRGLGTKTSPST